MKSIPEFPRLQGVDEDTDQGQGKDQGTKDQGKKVPTKDQKDKITPPQLPEFSPPPSTSPFDVNAPGSQAADNSSAGFNPHMMGDFGTFYSRQVITVTSYQTITTTTSTPNPRDSDLPHIITTNTITVPVTTTRVVLVPISSGGAFNVAENESPRPTDRVFGFYNFFANVRGADIGSDVPIVHNQSSTVVSGGTTTTVQTTTVTPGVVPTVNLNREVVGFEKTFFDGYASVEVRLPLLQQLGGNFDAYDVGDLTIVGKYAFYLDRITGNVVSGGLAVTAPTGPAIATVDGNIRSTLLQPWVGFIWNFPQFYVQGFQSVLVPTASQEPILMFNDIGINYWLYRGSPNALLSSVVPVLEAHVTTPLNHNDINSPIFIPDVVILTTGVHLGVYRNGLLTVGLAAPVTGPTPFSVETFVQFNWYF